MYQTIREAGMGRVVRHEALPAFGALVIAECFYEFHSFTLELFAFTATWLALSWLAGALFQNGPSDRAR